ncbi:MAG: cytochrome c [Bacteroidetes bacterium]|nr:cytochrome c [Bacteroidota bacterium]
MKRLYWLLPLMAALVILVAQQTPPRPDPVPERFGYGRPAGAADIARWDIAVRPDGKGLPAGSGTVSTGRTIYQLKCAACHGLENTPQNAKLLSSALVSRENNGVPFTKTHTIGNYWPYATTLFDYVRRAMPYTAAGSLKNEEVYALTAYLLAANQVVDSAFVANAQTLPGTAMPAQKLFVPDDRKPGPEIR